MGAELRVAAVFVNEAVPAIDIDDACLVGPAAVEVVEKRHVRRSFLPAQRRQSHPEHRYPGGLQGRNRVIDAPAIGFAPCPRAEIPIPVDGGGAGGGAPPAHTTRTFPPPPPSPPSHPPPP